MDVERPERNGPDPCRRLRPAPATAEIPVLMMTGFDPRPERAKMVEAGGDDLMVKPIAPRDLPGRVRALLRLQEMPRDLCSTPESLREMVERGKTTETQAPLPPRGALTP